MNASIERKTVLITPEVASSMLENLYPKQRKISQSYVQQLAREMSIGKWDDTVPSADPIMLNAKGELMNGQHRLSAEVVSRRPFKCDVLYNVPEESFEILDGGAKRSTAQFLNVKNATLVAALARFANALTQGSTLKSAFQNIIKNTGRVPVRAGQKEVIDYVNENEEILVRCAANSRRITKAIKGGNPTAIASAIWTICAVKGYEELDVIEDMIDDLLKDVPTSMAVATGKAIAKDRLIDDAKQKRTTQKDYWFSLITAMYLAYANKRNKVSKKSISDAIDFWELRLLETRMKNWDSLLV